MPTTIKKKTVKAKPKVTPKKSRGKAAHNPKWHAKFLELFGFSMNVVLSAKGAGVDRQTIYRERRRNPEFAAAYEEAKQEAIERLEADAYDRAKKASDTLLIFLLKSHKPEVYRENLQQQHSGSVEVVIRREDRKPTN